MHRVSTYAQSLMSAAWPCAGVQRSSRPRIWRRGRTSHVTMHRSPRALPHISEEPMSDPHDHDHDHDHEHHHHDGPHDYVGAIQGFRAEKDAVLQDRRRQPDPGRGARRVHRPAVLPGQRRPRLRGPDARAVHRRRADDFQIPTSDGRLRPAHRAGVSRSSSTGEPRQLTAYELEGAHARRAAVRAVPRRDERHRDVRRRPLPRPRARRGRDLRDRLQPRLPPVVRLRAAVLVPADAGREPPAGPDRGGRAARRRAPRTDAAGPATTQAVRATPSASRHRGEVGRGRAAARADDPRARRPGTPSPASAIVGGSAR